MTQSNTHLQFNHNTTINVEEIAKTYSEKDKVPVHFVCVTDFGNNSPTYVFYRETPHPEFGNRYFGIRFDLTGGYIMNADSVENQVFSCIIVDDTCYYSRYRHDYVSVDGCFIDGGRNYTRSNCETYPAIVKDGVMQLLNKE